jgi:hypothetical protein
MAVNKEKNIVYPSVESEIFSCAIVCIVAFSLGALLALGWAA